MGLHCAICLAKRGNWIIRYIHPLPAYSLLSLFRSFLFFMGIFLVTYIYTSWGFFFVIDRCHFCSQRCPHEAAVENMQSSFMLARDKFPSTIFLPFPFLSLCNVLLNCSKFHFIGWSPIRVRKVWESYYAASETKKKIAFLSTYI